MRGTGDQPAFKEESEPEQGDRNSAMGSDAEVSHQIPPEPQRIPPRAEHAQGGTPANESSSRSMGAGRDSIMNDSAFGERHNFNIAQGAAFSTGNPLQFATAVGRDMGSLLLGSFGFGAPKPENHPEMCSQGACSIRKANLRRQADKIMEGNDQREPGGAASKSFKKGRKRPKRPGESQPQLADVNEEQEAEMADPENQLTDVEKDDLAGTMKNSASLRSLHSAESLESSDVEGKDDDDVPPEFNRSSTTSSVSGDITVSGGHYNPKNDVILRLETMTANETRFLVAALWAWLTVAFAFLLYNFINKLSSKDGALENYHQTKINVGLGTFSLAVITLVLSTHAFRVCFNIRQGKVWKPRRRKAVIYTAVELVVQWLNLFFFVLPNYEMLGPKCPTPINSQHITYYSLVRWTCWNTFFLISLIHAHNANIISVKRTGATPQSLVLPRQDSMLKTSGQVEYKDAIVNDLPFLQCHWWKLVLWVIEEALVITCCVYYGERVRKDLDHLPTHTVVQDCGEVRQFSCRASNTSLVLVSLMVLGALVYFVLYCYFILKAFGQLKEKSNTEFRIANQIVRLQVRLRLPAFCLFTLSMILLWYVRPFTCTSFFDTWMGLLPGQLATSGCVLLTMFVTTPKLIWDKEKPPILQVWLQEFCWTEEEKQRKMDRRNQTMAEDQRAEIEKEPMFCMETMLNCLYWSLLIYDFDEVEDSRLTLDEACALYRPPLHQYELFWEKSLDTKLIVAWSRTRILLSFRGTASLANVVADLQAWRTNHHPKRNNWFTRPMVHSGFDKAWRNNQLSVKVLAFIENLFKNNEVDKDRVEFVVTGHSLGGALGNLAAFDLRSLGKQHGCDAKVTCITFGAPRVGNHAFSKEFQAMVPDCWHVINDQDLVARGAKFLVLYKRGGHRVLINKMGDLIVRPNPMEASMRLLPCAGSVTQHLLTNYMQSLLYVLLAQFSGKRLTGGMSGVIYLCRHSVPLKKFMEEAGVELKDLIHMERWGQYAHKVADVARIPITGRKSGAVARDMKNRSTDDSKDMTTRGGFFCGCCAPITVKVKEARSGSHHKDSFPPKEDDANIRDGGDTQTAGGVTMV